MVSKPWFEIRDEAEVKLRLKRGKKEVKKLPSWGLLSCGEDFFCDFLCFLSGVARLKEANLKDTLPQRDVDMQTL